MLCDGKKINIIPFSVVSDPEQLGPFKIWQSSIPALALNDKEVTCNNCTYTISLGNKMITQYFVDGMILLVCPSCGNVVIAKSEFVIGFNNSIRFASFVVEGTSNQNLREILQTQQNNTIDQSIDIVVESDLVELIIYLKSGCCVVLEKINNIKKVLSECKGQIEFKVRSITDSSENAIIISTNKPEYKACLHALYMYLIANGNTLSKEIIDKSVGGIPANEGVLVKITYQQESKFIFLPRTMEV